jgi:uncharacterized protein
VAKLTNHVISGCRTQSVILDAYWPDKGGRLPTVIFSHGYKGYKDWGAWPGVAQKFSAAGFLFIAFNFSYNGGTVDQPIDFPDLESFGQNNYSTELGDLRCVVDFAVESGVLPERNGEVCLIGHSRGGGIALLAAEADERIRKLATWAGVSDFKKRFPQGEELELWRQQGVYHVRNGRTHQDMPHYFQFYEDFVAHEAELDIQAAAKRIEKPWLIVHGDQDEAVPLKEAQVLHRFSRNSTLNIIKGAAHTFGASQPWMHTEFPRDLEKVVQLTIEHFKQE